MVKKLSFINLRKEIETLRDITGFRWIALRVADLSKRCTECMKQIPANYDQPSPYCKSCLGIGYSFSDKLVKGFRYLGAPGFDFKMNIGIINTQTQIYILEYNKEPKSTDLIFELLLDESNQNPVQPFQITSVYKIQNSFPLRGDNGRIEFWRCFVEEKNLSREGSKSIL